MIGDRMAPWVTQFGTLRFHFPAGVNLSKNPVTHSHLHHQGTPWHIYATNQRSEFKLMLKAL